MPKGLIVYASALAFAGEFALALKKRLESAGFDVTVVTDTDAKQITNLADYEILAIGGACRVCEECHGSGDCRATRRLRKRLSKHLPTSLSSRLIVFSISEEKTRQRIICESISAFLGKTGISIMAEIQCGLQPRENYEKLLNAILPSLP